MKHNNKPASLSMTSFMRKNKGFDNKREKQLKFIENAKRKEKFHRLVRHEGYQTDEKGKLDTEVDYSERFLTEEQLREKLDKETASKKGLKSNSSNSSSEGQNKSKNNRHPKQNQNEKQNNSEDDKQETQDAKKKKQSLAELYRDVKKQKRDDTMQKIKDEESKVRELKQSIEKRERVSKMRRVRTQRGQPIMKDIVQGLYSKLRKGMTDGRY